VARRPRDPEPQLIALFTLDEVAERLNVGPGVVLTIARAHTLGQRLDGERVFFEDEIDIIRQHILRGSTGQPSAPKETRRRVRGGLMSPRRWLR
jgi:hypothetical protein